jgi:hypothetical protein
MASEIIAKFLYLLIVSALVALLGIKRKIGYWWSLFACLFLSPIIGLIIILCSKKKNNVNHYDAGKKY